MAGGPSYTRVETAKAHTKSPLQKAGATKERVSQVAALVTKALHGSQKGFSGTRGELEVCWGLR